MKLEDAKKLHNGDEVTLKKTGEVLSVIDTEYIAKEHTFNNIAGFSVQLSNGNWYGYKEIR